MTLTNVVGNGADLIIDCLFYTGTAPPPPPSGDMVWTDLTYVPMLVPTRLIDSGEVNPVQAATVTVMPVRAVLLCNNVNACLRQSVD